MVNKGDVSERIKLISGLLDAAQRSEDNIMREDMLRALCELFFFLYKTPIGSVVNTTDIRMRRNLFYLSLGATFL